MLFNFIFGTVVHVQANESISQTIFYSFEDNGAYFDVKNSPQFSENARHGSKALDLKSPTSYVEKNDLNLTNKKVTVWIYDDASYNNYVAEVLNLKYKKSDDEAVYELMVGVNSISAGEYYYLRNTDKSNGEQNGPTSIKRTTGWHEIAYDVTTSNGTVVKIDGEQIYTSSKMTEIVGWEIYDNWNSSTYGEVDAPIEYDCVEIKYINAPDFTLENLKVSETTIEAEFSSVPSDNVKEIAYVTDESGTVIGCNSMRIEGKSLFVKLESVPEMFYFTVTENATDIYGTYIEGNYDYKKYSYYYSFEDITAVSLGEYFTSGNNYSVSSNVRTGEKALHADGTIGTPTTLAYKNRVITIWMYDDPTEKTDINDYFTAPFTPSEQ